MERIGRLLLAGGMALAMATVAIALTAGPAAAECDGPIPSFRDALRTARTVVIGRVVAVQPGGLLDVGPTWRRSSRFTLRVDDVPRGTAPSVLHVRDLPTQPCAPVVQAGVGDRIAIAFDATDFTPPIPVNTIAWIGGTSPALSGIEEITRAEVFRLLGLDPPDTATLASRPAPDAAAVGHPTTTGLLAFLGAVAGAGAAFRRTRHVATPRPCGADPGRSTGRRRVHSGSGPGPHGPSLGADSGG